MFSLQRLFGKRDKLFDLLEASAEEARHSVAALMELIEAPHDSRTLDEFILRRRQDKRITEQLTELMCSTFVTPLEREDIQALAAVLYRIPKTVEKCLGSA